MKVIPAPSTKCNFSIHFSQRATGNKLTDHHLLMHKYPLTPLIVVCLTSPSPPLHHLYKHTKSQCKPPVIPWYGQKKDVQRTRPHCLQFVDAWCVLAWRAGYCVVTWWVGRWGAERMKLLLCVLSRIHQPISN